MHYLFHVMSRRTSTQALGLVVLVLDLVDYAVEVIFNQDTSSVMMDQLQHQLIEEHPLSLEKLVEKQSHVVDWNH